MENYERLEVWKLAYELSRQVYAASARFPASETYGLTSQMRRAAISVPANIAEGSVRGQKEFAQFLRISLGSLAELGTFLRLAKDLGFLTDEAFEPLSSSQKRVSRMIQALLPAVITGKSKAQRFAASAVLSAVSFVAFFTFVPFVTALSAEPSPPKALVARFDGIISPVASEFLLEAKGRAETEGFDLLVVELDTPGGLDTSMRDITKAFLNSEVPVVVYVYPSGARAASAGVFIAMSAHVAAMAPGTNIGAAHPVMIGRDMPEGKEDEKGKKQPAALEDKVVNDAAAYLKSIAKKRGRNQDWAWEAVTKSTSTLAEDAAALGVVDLVAKDLEALLAAVDGRKAEGLEKPIRAKGAQVTRMAMTGRQRFLATVADPNVALILMSVGTAGILIELYSPGLIFPGVVGVLSLILGFYAFQTLSVNIAGVLLILFGMVLLILELKVVSYGLLTIGGLGSFILGVLMLFSHQPTSGLAVSWTVILSTAAGLAAFAFLIAWITIRLQRLKSVTGQEALLGAVAVTDSALTPKGTVHVLGEIWKAESVEGEIPAGAEVTVVEVVGLTLKVRRKPAA